MHGETVIYMLLLFLLFFFNEVGVEMKLCA